MLPLWSACAAAILLAAPATAATVSQTGDPFAASGFIDPDRFDEEQDRTLTFDRLDASLGTPTDVTLDCDFASAVSGVFDVQEPGGDWNVNAAAIVDRDEGGLDRQDGDGTGDGDQETGHGNRPDSIDVSAFPFGVRVRRWGALGLRRRRTDRRVA